MPQSLPASPRLYPSSTKASANIRRVASASLPRLATPRSAAAVQQAHVLAKAFAIQLSRNHCQSEENHARASLQIPAESKVNAAGISSNLDMAGAFVVHVSQ